VAFEIDEIKLVNGGITFNARASVVADAPDMRARFSDGADAPKTYPSHAANAFCLLLGVFVDKRFLALQPLVIGPPA
jgi:hypothetical protein